MTYGVEITNITFRKEPWRRGGDTGCLYVVEFDSGWVKIGQATTWETRHPQLSIEFRRRYGWSIVRHWQSNPVSAIRQQGAPRSVLGDLEIRLRRHAGQPDEVTVLSDLLRRCCGRGICGAGESETFRGQSFGDLVAYADVLTRCSASEA